mgnify:FL=1
MKGSDISGYDTIGTFEEGRNLTPPEISISKFFMMG